MQKSQNILISYKNCWNILENNENKKSGKARIHYVLPVV